MENHLGNQNPEFGPAPTTRILKGIAAKYAVGSPEERAIKLAARGLLFIYVEGLEDKFVEYVAQADKELTPEQKEHLRSLGINPDESNPNE